MDSSPSSVDRGQTPPAGDFERSTASSSESIDVDKWRRDQIEAKRKFYEQLREKFNTLEQELRPKQQPDEPQPDPAPEDIVRLADAGIAACALERLILIEETADVVEKRRNKQITCTQAQRITKGIAKRMVLNGDELWQHVRKKRVCLGGVSQALSSLEPRDTAISELIISIFQEKDEAKSPHTKKPRTPSGPSGWRREAGEYYGAHTKLEAWCHILGGWRDYDDIRAAHIVPFFFCSHHGAQGANKLLFGDRSPDLTKAANSLMLHYQLEKWFDSYDLIIVPRDPNEKPIREWQVNLLSKLGERRFGTETVTDEDGKMRQKAIVTKDLEGRSLKFNNDKRPACHFMYFHFVIALMRMRQLERHDWESYWQRYSQQPAFGTPRRYLSEGMLVSLASQYGINDARVMEGFITGQDLEIPRPILADTEVISEINRRLLVESEPKARRAVSAGLNEEEASEHGEGDVKAESEGQSVYG